MKRKKPYVHLPFQPGIPMEPSVFKDDVIPALLGMTAFLMLLWLGRILGHAWGIW